MEIRILQNDSEELSVHFNNGVDSVLPLSNFAPADLELRIKAARWINSLNETSSSDKKYLGMLLRVGDVSLWWWMAPWLFENSFVKGAVPLVGLIEKISATLEALGASNVIYEGVDPFVSKVIESVCRVRSLPYEAIISIKQPRPGILYPHVKTMRFFVRKLVWEITSPIRFLLRQRHNKLGNRKRILLVSGDTWQSYYDPVEKMQKRGDGHYGGLISALKQEVDIEFVQLIPKFRFWLRSYREKLHDDGAKYSPFEAYLDILGVFRSLMVWGKIRREWRGILEGQEFDFTYGGVDCQWWVSEVATYYFSGPVLEHILCYFTGRKILEKFRPNDVILSGENGPYSLSITLAGNSMDIPVRSLQHGFLCRRDFWIHFQGYDQAMRTNDISPIPRQLILYGEFYKRLLNQYAGIPLHKCVAAGAPRFDGHLLMPHSREENRGRIGVGQDNYVVLAAVNNPDSQLKFRALENILYAVSGFPNVLVVVKVHPAEAVILYKYKAVVERVGDCNVIFRTDYTLWPLFSACDIFITEFSTILVEAAAVGAPSILVDFFGMDYAGYYENDPCLGVATTIAELKARAAEILNHKVAKNTEGFAIDHLYALDGKATVRVAGLILGH